MQKVLYAYKEIFKEMNLISKYAIKYGTTLLLTMAALAVWFYTHATGENAATYLMLHSDLLYSIKECIGSVYILPMLAEILVMARKMQ